jgi:hypothetical protein
MSGHSKWATIKRKKGAQDAKRSNMFAKLLRAVEVAAREGGGNVAGNMTLASAVEKARQFSVRSTASTGDRVNGRSRRWRSGTRRSRTRVMARVASRCSSRR